MAKIIALITSDDVVDADSVPTYDDGTTAFFWGAFADSPLPNERVWCLLDGPTTREDAFRQVTERVAD